MCVGIIGHLEETWSDDAVPMGRVRTTDGEETVCLLYAPEARAGEHVLVHLGFVTEVLDAARAEDATTLRAQATREAKR